MRDTGEPGARMRVARAELAERRRPLRRTGRAHEHRRLTSRGPEAAQGLALGTARLPRALEPGGRWGILEDQSRLPAADHVVPVRQPQRFILEGLGLHEGMPHSHAPQGFDPVRSVEEQPAAVGQARDDGRIPKDPVGTQPFDQRRYPGEVHFLVQPDVPDPQDLHRRNPGLAVLPAGAGHGGARL